MRTSDSCLKVIILFFLTHAILYSDSQQKDIKFSFEPKSFNCDSNTFSYTIKPKLNADMKSISIYFDIENLVKGVRQPVDYNKFEFLRINFKTEPKKNDFEFVQKAFFKTSPPNKIPISLTEIDLSQDTLIAMSFTVGFKPLLSKKIVKQDIEITLHTNQIEESGVKLKENTYVADSMKNAAIEKEKKLLKAQKEKQDKENREKNELQTKKFETVRAPLTELNARFDALQIRANRLTSQLDNTDKDEVGNLLIVKDQLRNLGKDINQLENDAQAEIQNNKIYIANYDLKKYKGYHNVNEFKNHYEGLLKDSQDLQTNYMQIIQLSTEIKNVISNPKISVEALNSTAEGKIYGVIMPRIDQLDDDIKKCMQAVNSLKIEIKAVSTSKNLPPNKCDSLWKQYDAIIQKTDSIKYKISEVNSEYLSETSKIKGALKSSSLQVIESNLKDISNSLSSISDSTIHEGQNLNNIECKRAKPIYWPAIIVSSMIISLIAFWGYKRYKKKKIEDQIKFL